MSRDNVKQLAMRGLSVDPLGRIVLPTKSLPEGLAVFEYVTSARDPGRLNRYCAKNSRRWLSDGRLADAAHDDKRQEDCGTKRALRFKERDAGGKFAERLLGRFWPLILRQEEKRF